MNFNIRFFEEIGSISKNFVQVNFMIFGFTGEHSGKLSSSRITIAEKFLRTDNFSGAFWKMLFKFARNAFDAINSLVWSVKFELDAFALKFWGKFRTGNRAEKFLLLHKKFDVNGKKFTVFSLRHIWNKNVSVTVKFIIAVDFVIDGGG